MPHSAYVINLQENAEAIWRAILEYVIIAGDRLVVRARLWQVDHPDGTHHSWQWKPTEKLVPFLLKTDPQGDTTFYLFSFAPPVIAFMLAKPRLENWGPVPDYPENPEVWKGDFEIMRAISRLGAVYIRLPEEEVKKLEALGAILKELS